MSLILLKVKRKNHKNIILLTEEEYESTKETLYLLSNLANANRIKKSIEQAKSGEFAKVNLDD
ncbi:type II toxin-antitoxin system Phd/YefM family antitoxin [Rickettsia honei]|uniref:type II toxin-antitoxin system Phd/YefM family antitoxin n=1 Tax=Rickettsia honei TaxID=37816 RepID=UPI0003012E41|nr:type II toxin-antitoxin system Phd/YefM family antitoxin [Rickettsia honei]